jgi:ribosomal protein S18 acetylase RimI-like enzyme
MIRPLDATHRDAAVALWHACGLTRPWNDPHADFDRAQAVLGAFTDHDELIGTAMVGEDGHRGWVYYLAVDPGHREAGLGRALMQAAEEWVRARGIPKVQVMIRNDNAAVRGFYAALGWQLDDVVVFSRRF